MAADVGRVIIEDRHLGGRVYGHVMHLMDIEMRGLEPSASG